MDQDLDPLIKQIRKTGREVIYIMILIAVFIGAFILAGAMLPR